jgi:ABC transporter DrrB family efflux protein
MGFELFMRHTRFGRAVRAEEQQAVLRFAGPLLHATDRILDVGSGSGHYTVALAGRCAQVTAVDASLRMRRYLADRLHREQVPNAVVRPGRIPEPLQAAGPFAGVVSLGMLHYIGDLLAAAARMTPAMAFSDTVGITQRNLRRMIRTPQLIAFNAVQPIMFVLLFRYVSGGSIKIPGGNYGDYLMPAIFVQVVLFGGTQTAVGLATDLKERVIDRFRTLLMARSAVLGGRTLADLVRNVFSMIIMIGVGVLVGFRFHGSPGAEAGAFVLLLAFGYAFSWVFAAIGLAVKEPETTQVAAFLPTFPLIFASSAFVPVANMPGWLQGFASNQPGSVAVTTTRALLGGTPANNTVLNTVLWSLGMLAVFAVIAVYRYGKVTSS